MEDDTFLKESLPPSWCWCISINSNSFSFEYFFGLIGDGCFFLGDAILTATFCALTFDCTFLALLNIVYGFAGGPPPLRVAAAVLNC